jgi:hypothetical protein
MIKVTMANEFMKIRLTLLVVATAFLCASAPIIAKDKGKGKGGKPDEDASAETGAKPATAATAPGQKEPWASVDVKIGAPEQKVIHEYVHAREERHEGKKPKGLPPGLAKKVARGGELPPGWQKKVVPGQIMSEEVFKQCHPLPQELIVKLPPPPVGTITVAISGKLVRLAKATREILDVFDVH